MLKKLLIIIFIGILFPGFIFALTLQYNNPQAKKVYVAGDWNNWSPDADLMTKNSQGLWEIDLDLMPGEYQYKFVVDGEWKQDPSNPLSADDGFGGKNSVLKVEGSDSKESRSAVSTSGTTFRFKDAEAKTVHLAGEFNNWLDNEQGRVRGKEEWLMKKEGDVWTITVDLRPGTYKYKYVINGGETWKKDPNAPDSGDDNSLVTVGEKKGTISTPQTTKKTLFEVKASNATKVTLAGEFNNWNMNEIVMENVEDDVWRKELELKPGTYEYKFIQDGDWDILNKSNRKITVKLETGTSEKTVFEVKAPGAKKVTLAGEFNDWNTDELVLENVGGDMWRIEIELEPGTYKYKFLQDGDWDILNKDDRRITISAQTQTQTKTTPAAKGITITYNNPIADKVYIAGEFNNWDPLNGEMTQDADGNWSIVLDLPQGKYQYKFVVDGKWIQDPKCSESVDDGFGGKNSVIIIE
ncbi:MAG: glycogen-binding domain-containing protein [Candidatus Hydrogenedentota bacterium]